MAAAALLSVTLVPALMILFVRGRIIPEHKNPVNRFLIAIYRPVIRVVLKAKYLTILLAIAALVVTVWPARQLGSEFMPNLDEGTLMYMPTTLPGISVTKAAELLQTQDRIIKSFPEVESVFGKSGRADTATDPAPTEMFETIINLKPKSEWRPGVTADSLKNEMDKALQFPGVSNAWTMPIRARTDMLSTGIRTPVGVKVYGTDLAQMEGVARQIEQVLKTVPGTSSAYAERVNGGYFLDIVPDRVALGRYGLSIQNVQNVISMALGAEEITQTVEGRERYGVTIRYLRSQRSDPQAIARDVQIALPGGGTIPLGEVAKVELTRGATSIRTENGQLVVYIFVDISGRDLGGYVEQAKQAVADQVKLPAGYSVAWSGQFEYLERAVAKLKIVVPLTLAIIFLLLYLNFKALTETLIVMLSLPFALVGGIWLMWWLGFNTSVAVAVGFIALAGVAAETGVMMLIYLDQALTEVRARREAEGGEFSRDDLNKAIMMGAVERVRPKMMTVVAILTLYFLTSIVPIETSLVHSSGQVWATLLGYGTFAMVLEMMLGSVLVMAGLFLIVKGWAEVYFYRNRLITEGVYGVVRHPQYAGIFLVIFGQLVHWPTIPTLLLAPLLAWFYVRLAKREEGDLIERFGIQYEQYREVVPRFVPGW